MLPLPSTAEAAVSAAGEDTVHTRAIRSRSVSPGAEWVVEVGQVNPNATDSHRSAKSTYDRANSNASKIRSAALDLFST